MSKPENPSAFPACNEAAVNDTMGMTLRDWFAGRAMGGICAHHDTWGRQIGEMAEIAYQIADAMLAERAKPAKASAEPAMQHVAYYDEGQFHWMSGVAPRHCELFAKVKGGAA